MKDEMIELYINVFIHNYVHFVTVRIKYKIT